MADNESCVRVTQCAFNPHKNVSHQGNSTSTLAGTCHALAPTKNVMPVAVAAAKYELAETTGEENGASDGALDMRPTRFTRRFKTWVKRVLCQLSAIDSCLLLCGALLCLGEARAHGCILFSSTMPPARKDNKAGPQAAMTLPRNLTALQNIFRFLEPDDVKALKSTCKTLPTLLGAATVDLSDAPRDLKQTESLINASKSHLQGFYPRFIFALLGDGLRGQYNYLLHHLQVLKASHDASANHLKALASPL
eukprot:gene108-626_t